MGKLIFQGKKVTCEVTIMTQNIKKDKKLYKILGPILEFSLRKG